MKQLVLALVACTVSVAATGRAEKDARLVLATEGCRILGSFAGTGKTAVFDGDRVAIACRQRGGELACDVADGKRLTLEVLTDEPETLIASGGANVLMVDRVNKAFAWGQLHVDAGKLAILHKQCVRRAR